MKEGIKVTAQECFDNACEHYEKAQNLIEEMGEIYSRCRVDSSFNIQRAKKQFDILLQTILLKIACADNEISSVESKFIDKITDYIDILSMLELNFTSGRPITWANLETLNPSNYDDFCDSIDKWSKEHIDALLKVLIIADYSSKFDYLEAFTENILSIANNLCQTDGTYSESENNSVCDIICDKYYYIWSKLLEKLNNNKADTLPESNNSLKSQYQLKKNR